MSMPIWRLDLFLINRIKSQVKLNLMIMTQHNMYFCKYILFECSELWPKVRLFLVFYESIQSWERDQVVDYGSGYFIKH